MQFLLILGVIVFCALCRVWVRHKTYRECSEGTREGVDIVPILTIRARPTGALEQDPSKAVAGHVLVEE